MAPDVPVLGAEELARKVRGCSRAPPGANVVIRLECSDDLGRPTFSDPAQVSVYTPIVVRIFTSSALNPRFSPVRRDLSNIGIGGRDMSKVITHRWVEVASTKPVSTAEFLVFFEKVLEAPSHVHLPPFVGNSFL